MAKLDKTTSVTPATQLADGVGRLPGAPLMVVDRNRKTKRKNNNRVRKGRQERTAADVKKGEKKASPHLPTRLRSTNVAAATSCSSFRCQRCRRSDE